MHATPNLSSPASERCDAASRCAINHPQAVVAHGTAIWCHAPAACGTLGKSDSSVEGKIMKNFADLHLRAVRGALVLLWVALLVACASNSGKLLLRRSRLLPARRTAVTSSALATTSKSSSGTIRNSRFGPGAARRQDLDPADL